MLELNGMAWPKKYHFWHAKPKAPSAKFQTESQVQLNKGYLLLSLRRKREEENTYALYSSHTEAALWMSKQDKNPAVPMVS